MIVPVASSSTILLGLLGIGIREAILRKELGNMLLGQDSAISETGVVLVVELVRASHCKNDR